MNQDKTVIITGGTKGIGADIAKKFHQEGWYVMVTSRQNSDLVEELKDRICFQRMDVRNETDHANAVASAIQWTGQLDAYINCAGFSQWKPLSAIDEEFWDLMMDTNLKGTLWGCKASAPHLSGNKTIVNVSSLAGKRGSANNSAYCASKFGVNALTQALAKELGIQGIRVNAVCPVYVQTEGLITALQEGSAPPQGEQLPSFFEKFAKGNSALLRLPTGEEVANLCYFLSTQESSAITGQCINVDCGVMPQ
ncbi:MAG: SDR family oxidoreductase [SAR324 cluster bacterium]|nr:SDR family oxidoreductase [SAR324 cluster bacterium]